jgi:hypothetical protein
MFEFLTTVKENLHPWGQKQKTPPKGGVFFVRQGGA